MPLMSNTTLTSKQIETTLINLIEDITQDWDLDELDADIDVNSKLIANLNFASVDFIQLFVAIEDAFARKLGFHDLIMPNDKYVDDLSIREIVDFVSQKISSETDSRTFNGPTALAEFSVDKKLAIEDVAQFRRSIPSPQPFLDVPSPPNSPAVFILCPPRSGSTLLRVILAGHPQLFAPPEMHLLAYQTLAQRKAALSNDLNSHLLSGTIRAIMQIRGCSSQEAKALMQACEDQQMTIKQFYHQLQQWLGNRLLVDKTPSYAYHPGILQRIEHNFDNAICIHLVRHPYGMIRSFEDAKLDQLVPFMQNSPFSRRQLAELIWLISHQNILEFLSAVPRDRQYRVRFEDLVSAPETTVNSLCQFLGLDFYPEMLDPYQDKTQRMTDGVQVISQMSGDLKFHLHSGIEATMAERWKQYHSVDFLSDVTWDMAQLLGYER